MNVPIEREIMHNILNWSIGLSINENSNKAVVRTMTFAPAVNPFLEFDSRSLFLTSLVKSLTMAIDAI